jgi:ParB family transcriptional regulator, chromosome partitioning protein
MERALKTTDLRIELLEEAPWNPNHLDDAGMRRLRESLTRYGLVQPLVVRPLESRRYEVLNGNQRLRALRDLTIKTVPCVIVKAGDAEAMLLAEALNGIHGDDDLALKGAVLKKILAAVPPEEVLSLLPETAESLQALSTIGQEDLAEHLQAWQRAQAARLRHMQLQLSAEQLETVEKALGMVMARARTVTEVNPNVRGTAMYLLAKFYLERNKKR